MQQASASAVLPSVLVIDDHDIVRFGLEMLVNQSGELRLAGAAPDLRTALELVERLQPDLVISDMSMDDSKGLDTVRAIVAAQSPRPVLVLSMHDEMLYGEQVLALGARGYLMKESAHAQVVQAVLAILAGRVWISAALGASMAGRPGRRGPLRDAAAGFTTLSLREIEVLEYLGRGRSTKQIASELQISGRTVDNHRANIKRKLGLRTGAELLSFALSRT